MLWSVEPGMGFFSWWRDATFILIFVLAHSWWLNAHRRAWVAVLWAMGLISLALWPGSEYSAAFLAVMGGACFGLLMGELPEGRRWRWGMAAAGAASLAGIALAGSWSAGQALLFSALVCVAQILEGRKKTVGFLMAGCLAGVVLYFSFQASPDFPRLHSVSGVGPGLLNRVVRESLDISFPARLLLETGWIGLGIFMIALWQFRPRHFRAMDWEGRAASGALYCLLAHSFSSDILRLPSLQMVFFISLACAVNPPDKEDRREDRSDWPWTLVSNRPWLLPRATPAPWRNSREGSRHFRNLF